jgi:hypothetical protein
LVRLKTTPGDALSSGIGTGDRTGVGKGVGAAVTLGLGVGATVGIGGSGGRGVVMGLGVGLGLGVAEGVGVGLGEEDAPCGGVEETADCLVTWIVYTVTGAPTSGRLTAIVTAVRPTLSEIALEAAPDNVLRPATVMELPEEVGVNLIVLSEFATDTS